MTKEAKTAILKALFKRVISKAEAVQLLRTDGIILLDLSSQAKTPNPIELLFEKIPEIKKRFTRIISLGHGKKPE